MPIVFAVATACGLVCSSSAEPVSETAGIATQILQSCLSSPVQPTASPCFPGHADVCPIAHPPLPENNCRVRLPWRGLATGGMYPEGGQMSSTGADVRRRSGL